LKEIHYNYRGKFFKNKVAITLPQISLLDRYSPAFKRLRLNYGATAILYDSYMLSKMNMDYIPQVVIFAGTFEIEQQEEEEDGK